MLKNNSIQNQQKSFLEFCTIVLFLLCAQNGKALFHHSSNSNTITSSQFEEFNSLEFRHSTSSFSCLNGTSNLALGKSTTQSSTRYGANASRAVDGNTNGNWGASSVTHTNNQFRPFWEVDLGDLYLIEELTIWNRSDCCSDRLSDFYVFVSDSPFTSTDPSVIASDPSVWHVFQSDHPLYTDTYTLDRTGRYVRVQLNGSNVLSLAEVQVMGCTIPIEICDNGIDDDGNSQIDCEDEYCGVFINEIADNSSDDCPIQSNGEIDIDASGTALEYSIDNGITFQNQSTFSQLSEDIYEVVVHNATSGCADSSTFNLICPIMVYNTNDSGPGSLRAAIGSASDGDIIEFDPSIWNNTIFIDSVLFIPVGIEIAGDGNNPMTISGLHRRVHTVIEVNGSYHVSLKNMIIKDGVTGIHNFTSLSLERIFVSDCTEGIMNAGNLTMDLSAVLSNRGDRRAGGVINLAGSLDMSNTIVAGNSGLEAGGILNSSVLRMTNVLVSGNLAQGTGRCGAGRCEGGGILSTDSLYMINTTVAANSGLIGSIGVQIDGYAEITNSIVAHNTRPGEEPSFDILMMNPTTVLVSNSNLVADASGTNLTPDGVLIGDINNPVDPMFSEIISDFPSTGGNYSLACSSPAIDSGDIAAALHIDYDINGNTRIEELGVDIGAYENLCCTGEPDANTPVIVDHDLDNDGIPNLIDTDDDNDGIADNIDLDDDNDGISDCVERGNDNLEFGQVFDLAGDAEQIGPNEIRLTRNTRSQAGSAFSYEKVNFSLDFYFTFEANLGGNNGGADGIAIVFHNDPAGENAVGQSGSGLGALGIQNGIVLELDDHYNRSGTGDISADHGMIWTSESQSSSGRLTSAVSLGNIEDNQWHMLAISWTAATQTIYYTFDGQMAGSYSGDLVNQIFDGSDLVHFGFTASTGARHNDQRIRFSSGFCDFPTYVDSDNDGIEDYLDPDSDNDGCPDTNEYYNSPNADVDGNGMYGSGTPNVLSNGLIIGASYAEDYGVSIDMCTSICIYPN